jgi:UDP-N-acetylmuramate dehydrogenase
MPGKSVPIQKLRDVFGQALQENALMSNYTTAHVGGPADALIPLHTAADLEHAARALWDLETPFIILGSGSNILVSDSGFRGVVLVNQARNIKIDLHHEPPTVWAESGANIGTLARQVALRGLSGLEWAASIPGSLGGAVYGNAGANGGDMSGNLLLAEILHPISGKENWPVERMDYSYRSSALKRDRSATRPVILSARLHLDNSTPAKVHARMEEFNARRRRSQPPGASMGSMFKNPGGDYAGRLIEAVGLKGHRIGGAEISTVHANFFVNNEKATAADIGELISIARRTVFENFGVSLELEVELLGDWPALEGHLEI